MDKELLSILVCPVSKAALSYSKDTEELICESSGLAYPILDGIPVMLESRARVLSEDKSESKTDGKTSHND